MTDEELIARLRVDEPMCEEHFTANAAADRIEALVKERDRYRDAFNTNCLVLRGTEDRAERLEAALNDLGLEMLRSDETQAFMQSRITTYREALSFYAKWGVENPRHDDLVRDDGGDIARAALKGADHE